MRRCFLLILILHSYVSLGQFYRPKLSIDSLKQVLATIQEAKPFKETAYLQTISHLSSQCNSNGLFDDGLTYAREALILAEKLNLKAAKATAYFNIGFALQKQELYFEAVKNFEEAIEASKQSKNDSLLALCYHFAGMSYIDQKAYKRGILNYKKELETCKRAKLNFQTSDCLNSIGLYYFQESPDSALVYFMECLQIASKSQSKIMLPIVYKNVGRCYLRLGNEAEGVKFIKKSIELFNANNNRLVIYSYLELAKYYADKKLFVQSNQYAKMGYEKNLILNFTDLQLEFSQILYKNYQSIGNLSEAIKYLESYQKYSDKVNTDLLSEQNMAIEERFKSQQQKTQIALLNQDKLTKEKERNWLIISLLLASIFVIFVLLLYRTIKKQKSEIEEINQNLEAKVEERTSELQQAYNEIKEAMLNGQTIERKRVAAELHDNLGSILSAIGLSMEIVNQDQLATKEKSIFQHIQNQIDYAYKEVRLLSHNLQPEELEKYGLKNALEKLQEKTNANQKLQLSLDLENLVPLSKEVEFNIYSICLELINNTIKHAEASKAIIAFSKNTQSKLLMQYADNGKGMNESTKEGFGLQSIKNRILQIGGTLEIQNDNGTSFLILFN